MPWRNDGDGSRSLRKLHKRLRAASERMRLRLDPKQVTDAAVEAVQGALAPERTSLWLSHGGEPRLQRSEPAWDATDGAPGSVYAALLRGKLVENQLVRSLSMPIVAPRSGLLGVIHVEGTRENADNQMFIEGVAREAGFALETAWLYETAVAEKEKSEAILARVGDGVVVTDAEGRISQWNEAARRIAACPHDEAVGRSCHEALALSRDGVELDCSNGCPLLAAQAEGEDAALGVEVWRRREDGRRQPLLANVSAVRGPDGKVTEVVHSLRDITKLKEADEAKTMFLATASHELKTPLTVIQGFADALLKKPDWTDDDRSRALEAMRSRAAELDKVVNRMLLSSRIEAGRTIVETADVDIAPILRERAEALSASTGRSIVARVDPALPQVVADREALATVVDHLLDNANKYSPDGGQITLGAEVGDDEVEIYVADEGIGMDADQAENCFDKFWQAESSDVRRFGGTGIGLYIVQSLVRGMGGEIRVESTPGAGSRFTFTLRQPGAPLTPEPSIVREFMRPIGVPDRSSK